ncbi:MAG: hypothetical protein EXR66_04280 [Dehalococcoidia bacterium]|nr:hypothetical protein [Dehalococcoidia bacterium]
MGRPTPSDRGRHILQDCSVAARQAHRGNGLFNSFGELVPAGVDSVWLFRTPCLGSTFLLDGTRIFGPAPRGLDRFPTRIEGDTVNIDLRRIILGRCGSEPPRDCSLPGEQRAETFFPNGGK